MIFIKLPALGRVNIAFVHVLASVIALPVSSVSALAGESTRSDQILMLGNVAGSETVNGGAREGRAEFSFNDRGRGDHIVASWKLDPAGVPVEYSGRGNDYMKAAVTESFHLRAGKGPPGSATSLHATWENRLEHGESDVTGEAFYVPANPPPEFLAVLARALLQAPSHALPLLPSGEASIAPAGSIDVPRPSGSSIKLTQYRITGLDFIPSSVWLDSNGQTAGVLSGWMSVIPAPNLHAMSQMADAQNAATTEWASEVARRLTRVPAGPLLIRNARLFDPRDLRITPHTSVLIRGERIVRVGADAEVQPPSGAEIVDAGGRFLMPGLWDNHQHFSAYDGALDLANGVTSARDMANDTEDFPKRVARFDAGSELGPRVFKAGIIDGKGPLAGPTRMLVDTPAEALQDVDWYADHGYGQIKIYSSVKPELVPIIADEAHARGLRVSGHVPAFMAARQFVQAGADEIQHMNFIVLNFLTAEVADTRGMARFTAVAQRARDFGPDSPEVRQFIDFLVSHHTVLDPTMNVFEALFCGDPTAVPPGLEKISARFPPQVRRSTLSEALEVPRGSETQYREAFPAMLRLLKALHDAGVPIIPGTDALAGYTLHHELELYVKAGIPAAEVLRMATLTSARVIGADSQRGIIAAGKLADMILIDGDPTADMADLGKLTLVIKAGHIFEPAQIEQALGIRPLS